MYIIPAIDIIEGKCVRLTQGDYAQKKIYNEDPLEVAKEFEDAGLSRLHLVDLDGAKAGKIINYRVLERLASKTSLHIDFGGGLKSDADLKIAFECGARQITGGTVAVKNRDLFLNWVRTQGSEKIILGADVKNEKIAVGGWLETSDVWLKDFLRDFTEQGIQYCICTDISKDGLLRGASNDLYASVLQDFPDLKLIASGGVSNMDDLVKLRDIGCFGAIVGKAIYEGRVTVKELEKFNSQ
ncbi:MAG: 1-(5-phosphoribosyl)-5-[(5-phosphoribosylamino)methylideneamino]imidazole-4-carboxamide isomerase [Saprospiraceae bacterium]|nr:1-(5-phosphoribosyl)-5-[(5-phosphoribosylamino)methylideneamino]imidazole-4-carboxamide isomerase [Saprospiraceae bacterium]